MEFRDQCINPNKTLKFTDACANNVLKKLDISSDVITKCIDDSFEVPGDYSSDNKILREDTEE